MTTHSDLKYISRERLSSLMLETPKEGSLVVVDVRDSDHIGGQIKLSKHVPSNSLPHTSEGLVRQLQTAEKVVFHCALSQQRGPSAALTYLRTRERLLGAGSSSNTLKGKEEGAEGVGETAAEEKKQEVYVLDGGFVKWQEKYGEDERLTENYNKELWQYGY